MTDAQPPRVTLETLERRQRELIRAHRDILDDIVANAEAIGRIRAARLGLIRLGGHLSYEGYDVQTDDRLSETPGAAPVH